MEAGKLLAKLQRKSTSKNTEASDGNASLMQNGQLRKTNNDPCSSRGSKETTSDNSVFVARFSPYPGFHGDDKDAEPELENPKARELDNAGERQVGARNSCSGESAASSNNSPSSKGEKESNSMVDSDIRWEDLQLGEEIGQGCCYQSLFREGL